MSCLMPCPKARGAALSATSTCTLSAPCDCAGGAIEVIGTGVQARSRAARRLRPPTPVQRTAWRIKYSSVHLSACQDASGKGPMNTPWGVFGGAVCEPWEGNPGSCGGGALPGGMHAGDPPNTTCSLNPAHSHIPQARRIITAYRLSGCDVRRPERLGADVQQAHWPHHTAGLAGWGVVPVTVARARHVLLLSQQEEIELLKTHT